MEPTAKKRTKAPSFKLEIAGDKEYKITIMEKLRKVHSVIVDRTKKSTNNGLLLEMMMDFWLQFNDTNSSQFAQKSATQYIAKSECNEELFVVAKSSLQDLVTKVEHHRAACMASIDIGKVQYRGHAVLCDMKCRHRKKHSVSWLSSPKLANGTYLVNARMLHGMTCSGMLPVHYKRFSKGAGIGTVWDSPRNSFLGDYNKAIASEYNTSTELALLQEIAHECVQEGQEANAISILTDARHGWRKNAKDSSIVTIGEKSHQVIHHAHVTKKDDPVSQRHEKLGTQWAYGYLSSKDVNIKIHTHDRNMSINKFVRESEPVINQNDVWHSVKSLKKAVQSISQGPKYKHGKSWHVQLQDKVESVATPAYWAVKNCSGDEEILCKYLLNTVEHYKNNHENCSNLSRCKKDRNYEPSKIVVTDSCAEKLLTTTIKSSVLYKSSQDYVLGKETHYVESFNNVMNMFHDKRICFSDSQYLARSHLAVCHWNENVDRPYTSMWKPKQDSKAPRRITGKKNYKVCTYKYRCNIWNKYLDMVYSQRL